MSPPAVVIAAAIAVLTVIASVAAIESDPLGILGAVLLALVALALLIGVYVGDALIRSFRRVRRNDHSNTSS